MIIDDNSFNPELNTPRYADFGIRFGAALIDAIVLLPLIGASTYFLMFAPNFTVWAAIAGLSFLYKPVMEGLFGATVGKMILKIKVSDKNGKPPGLATAFTRALPWLIGSVLSIWASSWMFNIPGIDNTDGFLDWSQLVAEYQAENTTVLKSAVAQVAGWLPLISTLFMLNHARKQALHDRLAETVVVHKEPFAA